MKRRLLSVLLAVAMLAASFVALPVFAATENFDSIDVPLNKDSQVDFSQGYTGTVTVKFDLTVSAGTGNMRIWLPIHGNDRLGTANPMFSVNESGTIYAQQTIEIARTTPGSTVSIEWVYNCAAGTYTLAVNGGVPSGDINCGAQANVGGFAYKVINEKTATIANLTVTGETGEPDVPDLPMNINDRKFYEFDNAYAGIVTVDFDLNINAGSRFELWLEPAEQAGWENASNPYLQFTAEGDLWLQNSAKVTRLAQGQEHHFQVVVDLAAKEYTVAINGGAAFGPVAFDGAMSDIGGFDYRMQNTTGYIDDIQVSAVAAPFDNKVSASIVGKEEVVYPAEVTYDVVLSRVEGLNVLTLAFDYDPAVLTFKKINLTQAGLEALIPLGVDEENGLISATYGVKKNLITADDDTVWATLVFDSVEPGEEGVSATVAMTHFTASGVIDDGVNDATAVVYETSIAAPSATTKIVLPEPEGYTVSGAVVNYISVLEDFEIQLWAEGADSAAYTETVLGTSEAYEIADVAAGSYTLKVIVGDGVTREYAVTVVDEDITQDITIYMKGDVNLDGQVDYTDLQTLYQHLSTDEKLTGEALAVANVNDDAQVDYVDLQRLYQHLSTDDKLY